MKAQFHFILIDDNTLDLFIHEKLLLLNDATASVHTFSGGEQALHYLANEGEKLPESIILLDLQMPGMNGFEFADAFKKLNASLLKKMRLFILSSTVDTTDIEKVQSHTHIENLLSKPLDVTSLMELLNS